MTEDEAKRKWCPFVRTGAFTDRGPITAIAVNRDPRSEVADSCNCIASACMAWRLARDVALPEKRYPGHGHCGLAGEP